MKEIHTKKQLVDLLRSQLGTSHRQALKALVTIYYRQTEDERVFGETRHPNGRGFRGPDAKILTSLAQQYLAKGTLSVDQMAILLRRIPVYAGQLVEKSLDEGKIRKEGGLYIWNVSENK